MGYYLGIEEFDSARLRLTAHFMPHWNDLTLVNNFRTNFRIGSVGHCII